jgi:hypothetical protein
MKQSNYSAFMTIKKLGFTLLMAATVVSAYAIDDVTYTIASVGNGDIELTAKNNTIQRIVVNKLNITNGDKAQCLTSKDFIIEPHGEAIMSPFNQYRCFGLDNAMSLDSADLITQDEKPGNAKEDIRINIQYTRAFQPDPYSTNHAYSLFFTHN